MDVAAPVQKPPVPSVPPGASSVKVRYNAPVTEDEVIGHVPEFQYTALLVDTATPSEPVVRPQPVLGPDGKPVFEVRTRELDLTPYSPVRKGLMGALIGGGIGGALGAAAALVLGGAAALTATVALGPVAVGAAVLTAAAAGLGALGGGLIGALRVAGDQARPDWELKPVERHQFDGYTHIAIPQTTTISNGKTTTTITTGYHHHYTPDVSAHETGTYFWEPVVRHSSDG